MMIGRVTGHQVGRKNGYDLGFETPPLELVLNFAVDLNFQLFIIFYQVNSSHQHGGAQQT